MSDYFDVDQFSVDLTNCDREPIHLLGKVQSFGFLIAVSSDWIVSHVSENVGTFLDVEAEAMIGEPLVRFFSQQSIDTIRNRIQTLSLHSPRERLRDLPIAETGARFDVTLHVIPETGTTVLELEPSRSSDAQDEELLLVRNALPRLARHESVQRLCQDAARYLQFIIGFDRVMVYQFLQDGSGEVIAEARQSRLHPFLGLRYPASDIPKQARALYLKHPIRLIANTAEDGVPVTPARNIRGEPIDLSSSILRSVSPIHLEYLRNMDVSASMSISIVINGRLWGLFACHHETPIVVDHLKRGVAEMFGELFSLMLSTRLSDEERRSDEEVRRLTNTFSASISPSSDPIHGVTPVLREISKLLSADGFAIVIDKNRQTYGSAPSDDELVKIVRFLNTDSGNQIFSTHHIGSAFGGAETFADRAAGMLAIPISRSPRDYIIFFRREVVKTVTWAGNPDKPVVAGPNGVRLNPRKSFEAWQKEQRGQSEMWSGSDLRVAEQLRMVMLEVVLRFTDEVARERKQAQERQELLIAELNHRVRNILSLVKGIVSQSRGTNLSVSDYINILDTRIQSLARAHDQITKQNWSAASLHRMIEVEAASYLGESKDRIRIVGDDCLLEPEAFATLALVIHELTTNSAKYGALSASAGHVDVTTTMEEDGIFTIDWLERGGPAVKAPQRRGFGSTIVERSVPYELNGRATLDFELSGLHAKFELPRKHVKPAPESTERPAEPDAKRKRDISRQIESGQPKRFLVAEDNLILAMELEDLLLEYGALTVDVASNLSDAKAIAEQSELDFAILDVNLGSATSFPVAEILRERGIPFGFATGYGENLKIPESLGDRCCISKPYDRDAVRGLIHDALGQRAV
ncbi:HWE histidine kinase domain-containing protein [Notoacmeibacter ruber]|uniref:histidine kinase n=1 Tax=Notoacmeibacter ruber TaxID=2670375 RepID=A0A3L7J899_9HYPH|nr:HWE histidine kinase domain-containing protein [Notoacmeibacter ruber]RLQ86968.1 GAF domain-containing protein [Notoacmeibacter ruber]